MNNKVYSLLAICMLFTCFFDVNAQSFLNNKVIAHRGAWKNTSAPQNSIASLQNAIKLGCKGSEFDVRMTQDEVLVINHDPHFEGMDIEKNNYADLLKKPLKNGEPEKALERVAHFSNSKWELVWSDEFNYTGLPDTTKWSYEVGGNGWGNNELQYYTKADTHNVIVKNGMLSIIARKEKREKKDYTSARLVTMGKADWAYGRIEIRAKLPKGRGTWPAGWMLGSNIKKVGWPLCGEIDIMEHVGYDPDTIVGSIHTKDYNHIKGTQKSKRLFIRNPYTEFHTYTIEWTAEKMDFLLDDNIYLSVKNEHKTSAEWPFDAPQYLLLNLAVGGNWGGKMGVDDTIFPVALEVDYVRVFQ